MNGKSQLWHVVSAALLLVVVVVVALGGSLSPPPGPIQPTVLNATCSGGPWEAVVLGSFGTGAGTQVVVPGSGTLHAVVYSHTLDLKSLSLSDGGVPLGTYLTSVTTHTTVVPYDVRYSSGLEISAPVAIDSIVLLVKRD